MNHIPKGIFFMSVVIVLFFACLRWALAWTLECWGARWQIRDITDPAVLTLVLNLSRILARCRQEWDRVPLAQHGRRRQRGKGIGHRADHCPPQSIHVENDVWLLREQSALPVHNVGSNHGVFRHLEKLPDLRPAVVEFMI